MRAREASPELLRWMLEHYSPSHHEADFSRALAGRLEQRGWKAHVDPVGNTVASMGDGDTCIALLGHIDTVPGEIPVRLEGTRLFGRGAVDAKGALAAFIEAVELLDDSERAGKRFLLLGCVEEEVAITRGALHAREHHRPDFVVNGEPSGAHGITLGNKGCTLFEQDLPALLSFQTGTDEDTEWATAHVNVRTGPGSDVDALLACLTDVPDVAVKT